MKRLKYLYAGTFLLFALLLVIANILQKNREEQSNQGRNVVMNRIAGLVETEMNASGANPEEIVQLCFYDKKDEWQQAYNECMLPLDIVYLPADTEQSGVNNVTDLTSSQSVWVLYEEERLAGFLVFSFGDESYGQKAVIMNGCIIASFVLTIGIIVYIHFKILKPFQTLSQYPERLSKGSFTDKLPETKNRYFGKFVWSVNMLGDKMTYDKKHINRLIEERQTLLATIAHGIKTPVSNIKLYANAVETGLYQPDGMPNEKDAEIAVKINKNADDITILVQEMIQTSMEGLVDFEPNPQSFYSKEIEEYIEEEYTNRLKVLKIPCEVECVNNTLVDSDKIGILRILSQFLENAIKYGDGTGISVVIEKQEEGHYFTVRNKGGIVSESELPYLFNSFWRGSNAEMKEGSGIGLYEAKQIALRLSGDVFGRYMKDAEGMEFVLYIP